MVVLEIECVGCKSWQEYFKENSVHNLHQIFTDSKKGPIYSRFSTITKKALLSQNCNHYSETLVSTWAPFGNKPNVKGKIKV